MPSDVADRIVAEFAVRLRHRADEAHAARNAVEFARHEAAVGEDEVGPDHLRNVGAEAVLPRQLDDALGFALIEILGEEGRDRAARAARIERVERPVECHEVGAERFDLGQRRRREPEGLGGDAPGNLAGFPIGDRKEAAREMFDQVPAALRWGESGGYRRTAHRPYTLNRMTRCSNRAEQAEVAPTSERSPRARAARARGLPRRFGRPPSGAASSARRIRSSAHRRPLA